LNKDEYLEFFKKIHFKNLENISHYADSVGMSDDSRDLLVQSALFSLANSALDHEDETPEKVLSFFNESIFGLDDEDNLKEMMFPTHLKAYLWRLKDVVKPDSIIQMVEAIQSRHPKSLNRDIMLAICLKDMIWDCELPDLNRDLFYNEEIYDLIYRQSDKEEALPEITDAQGSIYEWNNGKAIASEYSNISELHAKEYAGKIVYLDLWATWCGPCLIANQSLSEVANFFKEDDIVFVSVAMRSDFEKWKKHASERSANCKDYFIKNEDDTALIMSGYKMNGFPAFRIISRNSKIINSNPPRPNSPTIYDTLSEILK
jgi:thiol-disulfide isomerase/thioredoxin